MSVVRPGAWCSARFPRARSSWRKSTPSRRRTLPGPDGGETRWDLGALEKELFIGIAKAAQRNLPISGISTNSNGIDYVLLDKHDRPLDSPPVHSARSARHADGAAAAKDPRPRRFTPRRGFRCCRSTRCSGCRRSTRRTRTSSRKCSDFCPIADYLNTPLFRRGGVRGIAGQHDAALQSAGRTPGRRS